MCVGHLRNMCTNKMALIIVQVLVLVTTGIKCESRKARLFSFNTVDEDIRIDLEFSIPFISIPVKKTMNTAFGLSSMSLPTININPASLALGGAVVLGTTVLIPLLLKSYVNQNPHKKYSRLLEAAEFDADEALEFASKVVAESRYARGCALKVACWTGQMPINEDAMKMWSHILSNRLLSSMFNASAVEDAMLSGRNGRECNSYKPCPLNDLHIPSVVSNIVMLAGTLW